jgi:rubrerythrin
MATNAITCQQTCRGICTSLEAATVSEQKAIGLYETLRDQCTYPEVRIMLTELIEKRRQLLVLIEGTQRRIHEKFDALDQVRDHYEVL